MQRVVMRKWFAGWILIKPGEGFITTLMFSYIFGVMTFYYILKPLRDGLFLAHYPASDLPYPNFLTAIFAGTLATIAYRLGRRISAISLLTATNILITATIVLFFHALRGEARFLPYVFYVYVQIVSVLSTAQFYLLASYVYNSRQAKRIYSLFGAGAIGGAMAGSSISGFLSRSLRLSTGTMLLICIVICLILLVLGQLAWRFRCKDIEGCASERKLEAASERMSDLLRLVFQSRHIRLMALLIFLSLTAAQLADWQVKVSLAERFQDLPKIQRQGMITGFLGNLNLVTNTLGVAFQLLLTNFIVSRFGITGAIVLLPMAVFSASWGVLMAPGLWTAVVADGGDAVFRYSIARAGYEFLYLPLPVMIRKRLKFFVDVFIDRCGRFAAALIVWAIVHVSTSITVQVRGTAAAAIAFTTLCLLVCLQLRRTYADAFRQQLTRREVDLSEINRYLNDPASVRLLQDALSSNNERQILYALQLLQSTRGVDCSGQLLPLLEHPLPYIRAEAVRTLAAMPEDHGAEVERLMGDPEEGVRIAVVGYICGREPARAASRLQALLEHSSPGVRLVAARWAVDHDVPGFQPSPEVVRSLLTAGGAQANSFRATAAGLGARLRREDAVAILRELLQDPAVEVRVAAARAAGAAGHLDLLFDVLHVLPRRDMRSAAREALVLYGERISGALRDVLIDERRDIMLRREIPWVLSRIPSRHSASLLVEQLGTTDPMLKYRVVKALNRLNNHFPDLRLSHRAIEDRILAETRAYYEALVIFEALGSGSDKKNHNLLAQALKERLEQDLEIIFRLLGLQYPQKDIYSAYAAIRGARDQLRLSALEFLDNILHQNLKAMILPLVEESSVARLTSRAQGLFGIHPLQHAEALRLVLQWPDVWLKACALYEIGRLRISELSDSCRDLAHERESLVRETAQWALERLA